MKTSNQRSGNNTFCRYCKVNCDHDIFNCPNVSCSRCKQRGHLDRVCKTPYCDTCKRFGHPTVECFSKYCSNCQKIGHTLETCFLINPCDKCGILGHNGQNCRNFCHLCFIYGHTFDDHKKSPKETKTQSAENSPKTAQPAPSILNEELPEEFKDIKKTISWADEMDEEDKRLEQERKVELETLFSNAKKNIDSLLNETVSKPALASPAKDYNIRVSSAVKEILALLAESPDRLLSTPRKHNLLLTMKELLGNY